MTPSILMRATRFSTGLRLSRSARAPRMGTVALAMAMLALFSGAALGQDMTGTDGSPCFANGTCAIGSACNRDVLCQACGGHGELACPGPEPCEERYRGFGPIASGLNEVYCGYTLDDTPDYRQNCGSAGFARCPGRDYCWGASVPDPSTGLCVACGLIGQWCCEGLTCREPGLSCDSGATRRCLPDRSAIRPPVPNPWGSSPPGPGGAWRPGQPPTGLVDPETGDARRIARCQCWSSDGRHAKCRANGCVPPGQDSMTCYWSCENRDSNTWDIRGTDGKVLAVTRRR